MSSKIPRLKKITQEDIHNSNADRLLTYTYSPRNEWCDLITYNRSSWVWAKSVCGWETSVEFQEAVLTIDSLFTLQILLRLQYISLFSESRNNILTLLLKKDAGELSASNYNHSMQLEISSLIRTSWRPLVVTGTCKKLCWCWKSSFCCDYQRYARPFLSSCFSLVLCSCSCTSGNCGAMASDITLQKASKVLSKLWWELSGFLRGSYVEKAGKLLVYKWLRQHRAWKTMNWVNVASSYHRPWLGQ